MSYLLQSPPKEASSEQSMLSIGVVVDAVAAAKSSSDWRDLLGLLYNQSISQ